MAQFSDPKRALLRTPLHTTAGPLEVTVPYQVASSWLEPVLGDPVALPGLLGDDRAAVVRGLVTGVVTGAQLGVAGRNLIEQASGMRWWKATALVATSCGTEVLGELTLCGVDPDRVSLGQWCAATYRVLTRNADAKAKGKIDFELELPPPGFEDSWDDGNDFALMERLAGESAQA